MASTYSNLSIELIGTGDQSGTWGTTTNTNLGTALEEAIVGTVNQAVTAGDLTLPWSTASNATQVARHLRLNLTGSSGGASNLIVPTLSGGKNYYIKNSSTTAITVKTAAGTGILVPAGNAMSLYQDGTNVVEAADYSTSYTIGTLTTTNDATINGLTVGKGANSVSTNTALGVSALASGSLSGIQNTGIGWGSLFSNTTGSPNTAVGYGSLFLNTTGNANTAIGMEALRNNTTASSNTAVGYLALTANTGGNNTAVGRAASDANTSGTETTSLGAYALSTNTTGSYNVALGSFSLYSNTTASQNTAVGYQSLYTNATGQYNTALGYKALDVATNDNNTALGNEAGGGVTTGSSNTIIGAGAGNYITPLTTGSNNIIIGSLAQPSSATVSNEVTIGNDSVTVTRLKGNVGIGTASPTTTLDVETTVRSKANAATNDATVGKVSFYNTNAAASANPERASIEAGRENSAWGAYLKFTTSTGTSAATERIRITSTGNVGIGTSSPSSGLEVYGTDAASGRIEVTRNTSSMYLGSSGAGGYIQTPDANPLLFYTNAAERMVSQLVVM
jgi:hypothetical protein